MSDEIVERTSEGAIVISGTDSNGYLVTHKYYYYSKREALAIFRREMREGANDD